MISEEKIKMWNVDGRTKSDGNSSHGLKARWAEKENNSKMSNGIYLKIEEYVDLDADFQPRWPPS
jgi:hypothetical protein